MAVDEMQEPVRKRCFYNNKSQKIRHSFQLLIAFLFLIHSYQNGAFPNGPNCWSHPDKHFLFMLWQYNSWKQLRRGRKTSERNRCIELLNTMQRVMMTHGLAITAATNRAISHSKTYIQQWGGSLKAFLHQHDWSQLNTLERQQQKNI